MAEICWEKFVEEILFVFRFDLWPGTRTLAFRLISRVHIAGKKYEKNIFLGRFSLSSFMAKTPEVNTIYKTMKKFLKKENIKIFLWRLPLSRFLAKNSESKYNLPWKSFWKIWRSESTLTCRSRQSRIKLMRTTWVVLKARTLYNGSIWPSRTVLITVDKYMSSNLT